MRIEGELADGGEPVALTLERGRVYLRQTNRWTRTELANRAAADVAFDDDGSIALAGYVALAGDSEPFDKFRVRVEQIAEATSGAPGGATHPALRTPLGDEGVRWQYAVVDIGAFHSSARMAAVLGQAGAAGWELITVFDKQSNWIGSMEKGFMMMKRPVPPGIDPGEWVVEYSG